MIPVILACTHERRSGHWYYMYTHINSTTQCVAKRLRMHRRYYYLRGCCADAEAVAAPRMDGAALTCGAAPAAAAGSGGAAVAAALTAASAASPPLAGVVSSAGSRAAINTFATTSVSVSPAASSMVCFSPDPGGVDVRWKCACVRAFRACVRACVRVPLVRITSSPPLLLQRPAAPC